MTVTFNPALATPLDRVRQRIGDTDIDRAQIQDETINAYLVSKTELGTARQLCFDLAAVWARVGTVTIDDQQQRGEKIAERYLELAKEIALQEGPTNPGGSQGAIFVGGLDDCRGPLQDDCCTYSSFGFSTRIPQSGP